MKKANQIKAERKAADALMKMLGYNKPKSRKRIIDPDDMICSKCKVCHSIAISNYKLGGKHYCGGIFHRPYQRVE